MVSSRRHIINIYIWCALGAVIGWLFSVLGKTEKIVMLENLCMGVFGAFIGGEFIADQVHGKAAPAADFPMDSLLMAGAGAVVVLLLLKLMRHKVGPVRKGGSITRKRDY